MIGILINDRRSHENHFINVETNGMIPLMGTTVVKKIFDNILATTSITKLYIVDQSSSKKLEMSFGYHYKELSITYVRHGEISRSIKNDYAADQLVDTPIMLVTTSDYIDQIDYNQLIQYYENIDCHTVLYKYPKNQTTDGNTIYEKISGYETLYKCREYNSIDKYGNVCMIMNSHLLSSVDSINLYELEARKLSLNQLVQSEKQVVQWVTKSKSVEIDGKSTLCELYSQQGYYPHHSTIIDLFKQTVEAKPNQIAVVCNDKHLTYKELNYLSDQVAKNVMNEVGKENAIIGILLDKSIEFITTLLGVLKAGFSYVPLDTMYPRDRIKKIIQVANLDLVVVNNKSCGFMKGMSEMYVHYSVLESYSNNDLNDNKITKTKPSDIAYIMFTSGSTGEPKGCVIQHESIINNAYGMKNVVYDMYGDEVLKVGVVAPVTFDMSVQQIYPSLFFGHTMHLIPNEDKSNASKVLDFLNSVDVCDGTPILLNLMLRYLDKHEESELSLRHFIPGGEALPLEDVKRYLEFNQNGIVTNIYGPTECTVEVTTFTIDCHNVNALSEIFIGKPMLNTRVYVLDDEKKMVQPGVDGEIYIAGKGVGLGYINNRELSEKFFVPDLFCDNELMYKTGDVGCWNFDGNLRYKARNDQQLKIRGYRIELGEIENVLLRLPFIDNVKVVVQKEDELGNSSKRLVAYFIPKNKVPQLDEIISDLKDYLPSYMMPSYFVPIPFMPTAMSGKVDIKQLPDYKVNALRTLSSEKDCTNSYVANEIVQCVANIVKKEIIHSNDSFMSVGGDSLDLFKFLLELEKKFQVPISVQDIDIYMSFKEIGQLIENKLVDLGRDDSKLAGTHTNRRLLRKINCLPMQNNLIKLELNDELSRVNHMVFYVKLKNGINYENLERAYNNVLQNNDAFRMMFFKGSGNSKVKYGDLQHQKIVHKMKDDVDFNEWTDEFPYFNLTKPPLISCMLFHCCEEIYLGVSVHHLISDYLSFHFFMLELENSYYKNVNHVKENRFMQYIYDSNRTKNTIKYEKDIEFWNQYKQGLNPVVLDGHKVGEEQEFNLKYFELDREIIERVKSVCSKECITERFFYLSAFIRTLQLFTEERDITLTTFVSGRNTVKNIDDMGFYSTILFYNHSTLEDELIVDKAKRVKSEVDDLESHLEAYNADEFITENADKSRILFDYQKLFNFSGSNEKLWDIAVPCETQIISYPFVFHLYDYGDISKIRYSYDTKTYPEALIERINREFTTILDMNTNSTKVPFEVC